MSAFICSPEHIANIAALYEAVRARQSATKIRERGSIAAILMAENIRSVAYRYPHDTEGNRPGPIGYTDRELIEAAYEKARQTSGAALLKLSPVVDVLKLVDSLEYQSCETPDYKEREAYKLLCDIRSCLITALPGHEEAPWSV